MFHLSDEQVELVEWAEGFARSRLADGAFDRRSLTPEQISAHYSFLGQQGLLGLNMPEEHGGAGRTDFDAMLVVEAVSRYCPFSGGLIRNTVAGPIIFLEKLGTDAQKKEHLADCVSGAQSVSVCMTEAEAGSDMTDMRARIMPRDDGTLVLNANKLFISHADRAGVFIVYARYGAADGPVCSVLVPKGAPGLSVGASIEWMGGRVFHVDFDDVVLDEAAWLVPPTSDRSSVKRLMSVYNVERLGSLFELLGIADLAVRRSAAYAGERRQFGRVIGENQGVAFRLADMAMRTKAARLMTYDAARAIGAEGASKMATSMARVTTAEMVQFVLNEAIHVHGGYGLTHEYGLEWLYRITRHHTIAGGTVDIHRQMIAKELMRG